MGKSRINFSFSYFITHQFHYSLFPYYFDYNSWKKICILFNRHVCDLSSACFLINLRMTQIHVSVAISQLMFCSFLVYFSDFIWWFIVYFVHWCSLVLLSSFLFSVCDFILKICLYFDFCLFGSFYNFKKSFKFFE